MPRVFAAFLFLAVALFGGGALAQTSAEVDAAVEARLGSAQVYREAFDAIQTAVADDDREGFAALVAYPINAAIDGEGTTIGNPERFVEFYDEIMTEEITGTILDQDWSQLFVSDQGLMFGDGQVWLNGICEDNSCAEFEVKIITIQSTAS